MRIDAHQHYWRIGRGGHSWPGADLPAIHRDFLPDDLAPLLARHRISRTVAVQSQPDDRDTDWLLDLAAANDSIGAVVGWVRFRDRDAAARITALSASPKLRGIRPMLQDLAPGWITDRSAAPALSSMAATGLVFDALVRPQHLQDIATIARRHPELRIVIDHAAKPAIAEQTLDPWRGDIATLAACPNVACKLSGMVTEARGDWKVADLRPYVDHLLAAFGPARLLWGSDWPVSLLAASYDRWIEAAEALLAHVSDTERVAVFGGNAARLYAINGDSEVASGGHAVGAA
jgi:L-fuconolactonase